MSDLGLGKIITTEQQRDAIHVAVAPVTAAERLYPAQPVGLMDGSDRATANGPHIGIVDPFLTSPVFDGQRFWLWLFPNTVTGMRHHWQHPAFCEEATVRPPDAGFPSIDESKLWVTRFAEQFGESYDGLMQAASEYNERGIYARDDSEDYKSVDYEMWPTFWRHFQNITGRSVAKYEQDTCPYTCSC